MKRIRKTKGFTLVEIMIVVLIIGILLAIAVPNFIKARETSRTQTCIANLRQIEAAKEQWAMEFKKTAADTPVQLDLATGDPNTAYIKSWPTEPSGFAYAINNVGTTPTCTSGNAAHVLP